MEKFKIRIIANACVTRYVGGERPLRRIIEYYASNESDQNDIAIEVQKRLPGVDLDES